MAELNISEGSFDPDAAFEDTNTFGGLTAGLAPPELPKPEAPPPVGFDEANNKVFVNGFEFDADDHDSALRSKEAFLNPVVPMPVNYRPMGAEEFGGYIKRISDPSIGRIIKKNFGIGIDNLQLLGGRGLQFLGATETGQKIVDQQVEDLAFTQPYQRLFTDIDSAGGAVEWFVANLAQQGPMLIESALSAIAGGIAGGVIGGNPFTAVGGMFLALSGKAAVKRAAIEAAKKHAAGEALDKTEEKFLRELASGAVAAELKLNPAFVTPLAGVAGKEGLKRGAKEAARLAPIQAKRAARTGGAILGSQVSNLGIGVSDIYGEQLESGTGDRATAALLAIPYSLAETLPELLGLGFFIKGGKNLATGAIRSGIRGAAGRTLKRGGRAAKVGAVAAVGEGATEAFQESLLLSQNPETDFASDEGIHRLINSFAAGAGVGGAIGTVGGAVRRHNLEEDNADILKPIIPPTQSVQQELFPYADLGQAGPTGPDQGGVIFEDTGLEQGELFGATRAGTAADRVTDPGGTQLDLFPEATTQSDEDLITKRSALFRRMQELNAKVRSGVTITEEEKQESRELADQFKEIQAIFAARFVDGGILDPGGTQLDLFPEPVAPVEPAAPPAPVSIPPLTPTAAPVSVDFPPGAGPAETQAFLAAQEATPNAALAAPLQAAADQGRAQRVAAERDAAVQQQRQQQFDEATSARQTQELDQALEGSVAPVLGEQLELGVLPQGAPRQTGIAPPPALPAARFVNGEEAIASPTDGIFTPVRELIEKAQQNFVALKKLEKCLGT